MAEPVIVPLRDKTHKGTVVTYISIQLNLRYENMLRKQRNRSEGPFYSEPLPSSCRFHHAAKDRRRQSRSLNDLECHCRQSSSSIEALKAAAQTVSYPLSPCQRPPSRSSTPPGLPSFGTREAQQLRLEPPPRSLNFGKLLQRLFIRNNTAVEVVTPNRVEDRTHHQNSEYVSVSCNDTRGPVEFLRRTIGTSVLVTVPANTSKHRRATLPKGIVRAYTIGSLAQAEDGSHIRGRFGHRASGHGIGQRTVNMHPFSHLDNTSGQHNITQESDKACVTEDRRLRSLYDRGSYYGQGVTNRSTEQHDTHRHIVLARSTLTEEQPRRDEEYVISAPKELQQEDSRPRTVAEAFNNPSANDNRSSRRFCYETISSLGHETTRDVHYRECLQTETNTWVLSDVENTLSRAVSVESFRTLHNPEPAHRDMIEPLSYVSCSRSSDPASHSFAQVYDMGRNHLPIVENILELQGRERNVQNMGQQRQEAQSTSVELC